MIASAKVAAAGESCYEQILSFGICGKLLGVGADAYGYWQDVCDGFGGEVVSLFPIFSECNKRKGVNFFFCIIYFFMLLFVYHFPVF